LRALNHCLINSKSGKSAFFRVLINDRYGETKVTLASVSGWRAHLAKKYLSFDSAEWNDHTVRRYVGIKALGVARDRQEAVHYIDLVRSMGSTEAHFWASKFLGNDRAHSAWRALYR